MSQNYSIVLEIVKKLQREDCLIEDLYIANEVNAYFNDKFEPNFLKNIDKDILNGLYQKIKEKFSDNPDDYSPYELTNILIFNYKESFIEKLSKKLAEDKNYLDKQEEILLLQNSELRDIVDNGQFDYDNSSCDYDITNFNFDNEDIESIITNFVNNIGLNVF